MRTFVRAVFFLMVIAALGHAQSVGTSIYTVAPRQVQDGKVYLNYDSGYGVRSVRPFGEDGVEQRIGVVYGIGKNWSLISVASGLVDERSVLRMGSAQIEVLRNVLTQENSLVNLSAGMGFLREYAGVNVLMARFAVGRDFERWNVNSNTVLEKPFATARDAVDVITTFSSAYQFASWLWGGIDAIGEDLEGFFEPEEAEGGAKFMIGPTLQMQLSEKMRLRIGGGPIFYLTQSKAISQAPRLLPPGKSGYTVRFSMIYGI